MKNSLVTLLLSFLVSVSAMGFAADAGKLILGKFDATSKKERIEIARDLLREVKMLSDYVATPKPSEIDWVLAELEAIDGLEGGDAWRERGRQLFDSAEYQNRALRNLLDKIESTLVCVTGEDPSIEGTGIEQEMLCWSLASFALSTRSTIDDAIPVLIKHGRLPKDIKAKADLLVGTNYSDLWDWWGRGVHEFIVIPYLQGKITK